MAEPKQLHETFEAEVEAFLVRHGMAASRLGALAVGDTRFVANLRRGRSPRLATADRVRELIRDYRPKKKSA